MMDAERGQLDKKEKEPASAAQRKASATASPRVQESADLEALFALKGQYQAISSFLDSLSASAGKLKDQLHEIFNREVSKEEKYTIYRMLGTAPGRSEKEAQDAGRKVFETNLKAVTRAVETRMNQLDVAIANVTLD